MRKYKIGVLGCAQIAIKSLLPAFSKSNRFELAGIASRDCRKSQALGKEYDCPAYDSYDAILDTESIDMVYIPLPTGLHYEWIHKALSKGKHVMSEKSLACTYEEVDNLTQLAREKNLLLIENFQFRFHSQHIWVKNLLINNDLGEIRCFRSSFGFPPFPDKNNIRYSKILGGGALLDTGSYTIKSMLFLFPNCNFKFRSASLYKPLNMEVDIYGGAYFDCEQGIIAELAFGFDNFYQCGYEIWGSKGKLTTTRAFTAPIGLQPVVILEKQGSSQEISLSADDHFSNMLLHIADCLDTRNFSDEYSQNLNQSRYIKQIKDYCDVK